MTATTSGSSDWGNDARQHTNAGKPSGPHRHNPLRYRDLLWIPWRTAWTILEYGLPSSSGRISDRLGSLVWRTSTGEGRIVPRRASKWILHDNGKSWDLSRGGRQMYGGMASKEEALSRLKNHYRPGEPVILEESDGYRQNITNQLKKSGII